jgi:hypothetical protein
MGNRPQVDSIKSATEKSTVMSARCFLAAALLALAGCGAMEWQEPAETEALLAAAGFQTPS